MIRGLGKLNLMAILKKILFASVAGSLGFIIGGGSIIDTIAAFVLAPIVTPYITRLTGGLSGGLGRIGVAA